MRILAFDSSLGGCSAALWSDDAGAGPAGRVVAAESVAAAAGQAEVLPPMIARVVAAGGGFAALDRLAVTTGPGHFTGLRAGLALARGLALATGLPLVGISTLAAVAAAVAPAARQGSSVVVALDSKRAEGFFQIFTGCLTPLGEPESTTYVAFAARLAAARSGAPLVLAGTASALLTPALDAAGVAWVRADAPERPMAEVVARAARGLNPADAPAIPLYLHPPATTLPPPGPAARSRAAMVRP